MEPLIRSFFIEPSRHLETLDGDSARQLLEGMRNDLPFCKDVIDNLAKAQESLNHLEKGLHELDARDGSLFSEEFQECRALFNRTVGVPSTSPYLEESVFHDLSTSRASSTACLAMSPHEEDGLDDRLSIADDFEILGKTQQELQADLLGFIRDGKLAHALYIVSKGSIKLEELDIDPSVKAWMQINLTFHPDQSTSLDEMALTHCGDRQGLGFGYKSANLTRLKMLSQAISMRCSTCHVVVPEFHPVSDFEMQRYIMTHYPGLQEDWRRFITTFTPQQIAAFTAGSLTLSDESKAILKTIRDQISAVFAKEIYDTPQLQEWLARENPNFVIVRSTGKEDSDTNSNAGGNASLPFIAPNAESISRAMGEVLASYFGEKSILQRLDAGDSSIFEDEVFLPVLIQEMVGEAVGGEGSTFEDVPRSGVMFTRSGDRAKGLTEICVGLGNNEGIVSSRVDTDRYLVSQDGGVAKSVHHKGSRFVAIETPEGAHICEPIKNDQLELKESAALTDSVARDIKLVGDYFSGEVYGSFEVPKALDMEFSVIAQRGQERPTLYLLQARPLLTVEHFHVSSYLEADALSVIPQDRKIRGKTLLDGGSYVRSSETSGVIVCDTITQALDQYLKSPADIKSAIKTIVIRKSAPSTSHEAVTFRSRGIGILIVENEDEFRSIQRQSHGGKELIFDLQRGLVVQATLAEISPREGYTCYPTALEYSITPSKMIIDLANLTKNPSEAFAESTRAELKKFDDKIQNQITLLRGSHELLHAEESETSTWRSLLEKMGSGEADLAKLASATLLHRLQKLTRSPGLSALPMTRLELLMLLQEMGEIIEKQFTPVCEHAPQSLERLYPIRLLEACLFQQGDVIGGFSVVRCLQAIRDQREILNLSKVSITHVIESEAALMRAPLIQVGRSFLKPTVSATWQAVIRQATTLPPELLSSVITGVQSVRDLGILAAWSNTSLEKMMIDCNLHAAEDVTPARVIELFTQLSAQMKAAATELDRCRLTSENLQTLHSQMAVWADPSHIKKYAPALIKSMVDSGFTKQADDPKSLASRYKAATPLERLALLETTLNAVRTYDEIIKTLKASTLYKDPQLHAVNFRRFLDQYRDMMMSVVAMAQKVDMFTQAPGSHNNVVESEISIAQYFDLFNEGKAHPDLYNIAGKSPGFIHLNPRSAMSTEECAATMLPSGSFNVASATLGSVSDYEYSSSWPITLEDYFTLMHQNMETAISKVKSLGGIPFASLPFPLQRYYNSLGDARPGLSISSITVKDGVVDISINMPLRQHAGTIRLSYDTSKPDPVPIHTRIEMFGADEHNRWELVAGAASLIGSDLGQLQAVDSQVDYVNARGVSFEFIANGLTQTQLLGIGNFLKKIATLSCNAVEVSLYVKAVDQLRRLFNPEATDMPDSALGGGFYCMLAVAEMAFQKGDNARALALIASLEARIAAQPWIGDVVSKVGFFGRKFLDDPVKGEKLIDSCRRLRETILETGASQRALLSENQHPRGMDSLFFATAEQKSDPVFVCAAIKRKASDIHSAHPSMWDLDDIMLEVAKQSEVFFNKASSRLKSDLAFAMRAVQANGNVLQYLSSELRENMDVVMEAVKQNPAAIFFARPSVLGARPDLIRAAIVADPILYGSAPLAMQEDPHLAMLAVMRGIEFFDKIPHVLQTSKTFVKDFLLQQAALEVRPIEQIIQLYENLDPSLQGNTELACAALKCSNNFFGKFSLDLRMNKEVVLAALRQGADIFHLLDPSLQSDMEVIITAVSHRGELLSRLDDSLRANKNVVKAAVGNLPSALVYASSSLQRDVEILAAAWG